MKSCHSNDRKQFSHLKLNGFTLVEVLISLGLLMALLMASSFYLAQVFNQLSSARGVSSRDKIISSVERFASLSTSLRNSLIQNTNLEMTLCTTPEYSFVPNVAGSCINAAVFPLELYGPIAIYNSSYVLTSSSISGGPGRPGRFNSWGEPCPPGSSASISCPIEVETRWRPHCPVDPTTTSPATKCDIAELIEVLYKIKVAEGIQPGVNGVPSVGIVEGSVLNLVYDITGREPSQYNFVIPTPAPPAPISTATPAPTPTPTPDPGNGTGNPTSTPIPDPTPPPTAAPIETATPPPLPANCPGDTIQSGPDTCVCPGSQTLVDPGAGRCQNVGI